jgi:hypothetical protein
VTLDQIRQSVASADAEARGRAMQDLLNLARKNKDVHQEALGIFMGALMNEQAPWAAISAARGVAFIAGEKEGRRAWRTLLDHPNVEMVAAVAAVVDASHGMHLLQVLDGRAETAVQIPVVRALGRLKVVEAFDPIVKRLADRDVRPHAIEALADLGDARAVDHLKKHLTDKTEAWPDDNHGPMLRIRDLAKTAIERLTGAPSASPPARVMKAPPKPSAGPTKLEPKPSATNTLAYLPMVGALVMLPWFAAVFFTVLFTTGTFQPSDAETRKLDLVAMVPAALGILGGVLALTRGGPKTTAEKVCFVLGLLLCGLFVFSFGSEFLNPETAITIPIRPG